MTANATPAWVASDARYTRSAHGARKPGVFGRTIPAPDGNQGTTMRKLLLCVLCVLAFSSGTAKTLPPGTPAPNDLGRTLAGQQVTLASLRGKAVVISFWATWCKYCLEEMPILGGLQATANERHLPLQVVEINYQEDHRTFVGASHLLLPKLPGLLLTWDRTGALARPFGVGNALPAMILLHRDGTIAKTDIGYDKSELDSLVKTINQLMNEPAPAPLAAASAAVTPSAAAH